MELIFQQVFRVCLVIPPFFQIQSYLFLLSSLEKLICKGIKSKVKCLISLCPQSRSCYKVFLLLLKSIFLIKLGKNEEVLDIDHLGVPLAVTCRAFKVLVLGD